MYWCWHLLPATRSGTETLLRHARHQVLVGTLVSLWVVLADSAASEKDPYIAPHGRNKSIHHSGEIQCPASSGSGSFLRNIFVGGVHSVQEIACGGQ